MKLKLILFFCLFAVARARFVKRILGGEDADPTDYKNIISLHGQRTVRHPLEFLGAGIIYTANWILVSATSSSQIDVVYPRRHVLVYAGKPELRSRGEFEQGRSVVEVHTHDDYNADTIQGSVHLGLLKLNESLIFNEYVGAYRISQSTAYPEGYAYVAGWGASNIAQLNSESPSNTLKEYVFEIMPLEECSLALFFTSQQRCLPYVADYMDTDRFCSFDQMKGPSYGDHGDPVMEMSQAGDYEVTGLTFLVPLPTDEEGPTFYLQLSHFIHWIFDKTGEEQ